MAQSTPYACVYGTQLCTHLELAGPMAHRYSQIPNPKAQGASTAYQPTGWHYERNMQYLFPDTTLWYPPQTQLNSFGPEHADGERRGGQGRPDGGVGKVSTRCHHRARSDRPGPSRFALGMLRAFVF